MQVANYIVKNGKKHFKCSCSLCGDDRGYQPKVNMSKLCTKCSINNRKQKLINKFFRSIDSIEEVFCTKCNSWYLKSTDFWKIDNKRSGYSAFTCKKCSNASIRQNRLNRSDVDCKKCGKRIGKDTKNCLCRICFLKYQGSFRNKGTDRNERQAHRYNTDYLYRLDKCIRSLIYRSLRGSKSTATEKYLGCTIIELKEYLESKFQYGMSWNNYGRNGWHIDHIIPSSSADSLEELIRLQHYTNLQPLWEIDNLQKGAKINIKGDNI